MAGISDSGDELLGSSPLQDLVIRNKSKPEKKRRTDREKRTQKLETAKEKLRESFGDHLALLEFTPRLRQLAPEMENETANIQGRVRRLNRSSEESVGDDTSTRDYVDSRVGVIEEITAVCTKARDRLQKQIKGSTRAQEKEIQREIKQIDGIERAVKRERYVLAAHRARIELQVSTSGVNTRMVQAYLQALTSQVKRPSGAQYEHMKRDDLDQQDFRDNLIRVYQPEGERYLAKPKKLQPKLWCPVTEQWHDKHGVRAAHIVPHSIGEIDIAYLFGQPADKGHSLMWGQANGIMLHNDVEEAFDAGQLVIVPDEGSDDNGFKTILLSEELKKNDDQDSGINRPWSGLHGKPLVFKTDQRPGKRFLYAHTLLTAFVRRRWCVKGWGNDREVLFSGRIWGSPGKWLRKSQLLAIAAEVGDGWDINELPALGEFDGQLSPAQEKEKAVVMTFEVEEKARSEFLDAMDDDDSDHEEQEGEDVDEAEMVEPLEDLSF